MEKILNKEVNPELAKLLKEKGFDEPTLLCYDKCDMLSSYVETVFKPKNYNTSGYVKSSPTIAEVVGWIFKKYDIFISVNPSDAYLTDEFTATIFSKKGLIKMNPCNSIVEAYESAITYCLNKFETI